MHAERLSGSRQAIPVRMLFAPSLKEWRSVLKDTLQIFAEMEVPVRKIRLGGGGARSPLWRQIQADIYEHEVEVIAADEGAAYGAALLAGVGGGLWPNVDTACNESVKVDKKIAAQAANAPVLRESYAAYRRLYPALKTIQSVSAAKA